MSQGISREGRGGKSHHSDLIPSAVFVLLSPHPWGQEEVLRKHR